MAVPGYQTMILPTLELHADGEVHRVRDLAEHLADYFELSEEDRQSRTGSGRRTVVASRAHWARYDLLRSGALESTGRGTARITERGRELLRRGLPRIDRETLSEFPEFVSWITASAGGTRRAGSAPDQGEPNDGETSETPEELLERAFAESRRATEANLLEQVLELEPSDFEELVVKLLVELGYAGEAGEGLRVGRSGDGGIDGVVRQDPLGLDLVYLQAKRWSGTVGRPTVQEFVGSLEGQRADKGVLITTSSFSRDATAIGKRVILVDGLRLASLMFDVGLGLSTVQRYEVKAIDRDFFEPEEG